MPKRTQYTKITPLPSNIPRQLAIELLHSHQEVIEINPLVTGVKAIEAPRDAPNDEYFSQWYEIAEVITWGFGMKKKISFKGVFHNLPYGMQSHTYAPMGVDLRIKYRIGGNQQGEPRETRELGVDTPLDGLYLRQDVEIVCNMALASFVKKETKEVIGKMIDRLVRKAELLDEGKLHAMFEDGRLKTSKPSAHSDTESTSGAGSVPGSPNPSMLSGFSQPRTDKAGYGNYHDVVARSASQYRTSQYLASQQQNGFLSPELARVGVELPTQPNMPMINELPGSYEQPQRSPGLYPDPLKPQAQVFRSELPGDISFNNATSSPPPPPQPAVTDSKPPVVYQAYPPPPPITGQHPAERGPIDSNAEARTTEHHRVQSYGSQGNITEGQRGVTNSSDTASNYSHASSAADQQHQQLPRLPARPTSNIVPDHLRFSQLSVQHTTNQESTGPTLPQHNIDPSSVRCPVCYNFEGDAAAVNHHVSTTHFS